MLAELAIDSVLYHLSTQDIRIFEIEVEEKSQNGRRIIGRVAKELKTAFWADLRVWRFGKLVTGKKIERLLKEGDLQPLLQGSALKPEAFNLIERT